MAIRLWYQSLSRDGAWTPYRDAMNRILDRVKDKDTEIHIAGTTRTGGVADQFRYLEFLATTEVLENCQRAVREGYDAFLIGNIADPGLKEAREIANIPVLGLCETAMHTACLMGASFGFVTLNEKYGPKLRENAAKAGLSSRLAGVGRMDLDRILDMNGGFTDPVKRQALAEGFLDVADGPEAPEVVIAGGGVMMALLAEAGVTRTRRGATVLNGVLSLVTMAEAAVRMNRQLGGAFTSKRLTAAPPAANQIAEIRRYCGDVYPTVVPPEG